MAAAHLAAARARSGGGPERLCPDAVRLLEAIPWYGGYPEFLMVLDQLAGSGGPEVGVADVLALVDIQPDHAPSRATTLRDAMRRFERAYIRLVLERNSGTIQQAAARLGVHRPSLHRKMRTLGLRAPKRRAATLDG